MNYNYYLLIITILSCAIINASPDNDGKYRKPSKSNSGLYVPDENEGKYNSKWRYRPTPDYRQLGQYHHVHIPYDGGYGPYSHIPNPYDHIDNPALPYDHINNPPLPYDHINHPPLPPLPYSQSFDNDRTGDASHVSNVKDPFKNDVYDYNTPEFYQAYGAPFPGLQYLPGVPGEPITDYKASASNRFQSVQLPPASFNPNPTVNTNVEENLPPISLNAESELPTKNKLVSESLVPKSSFEVLEIGGGGKGVEKHPIDDSGRRVYNDEGGWKILKQKGEHNTKKYGFAYETENGILAEEHAELPKSDDDDDDDVNQGTAVDAGFYQYTGDDGKIYRVDYTAGTNGFVPKGDHIPTPPPVPKEIRRLLDYLKEKEKL